MKSIRPEFTEKEYEILCAEAERLNVSLKRLAHDRTLKVDPNDNPLYLAQILADEMAKNREVLNRIIKRETTAEIRLYEDDVIHMEMKMAELESIVSACISEILRKVG